MVAEKMYIVKKEARLIKVYRMGVFVRWLVL